METLKLVMWSALDEETRLVILMAVVRLSGIRYYRRSKIDILSEEQNHRCCYCGVRFVDRPSETSPKKRKWKDTPEYRDHPHIATIEHVIRRCEGGLVNWDNEVAACRDCNSSRDGYDAVYFYEHRLEIKAQRKVEQQENRRRKHGRKNRRKVQAWKKTAHEPLGTFRDIWPEIEQKIKAPQIGIRRRFRAESSAVVGLVPPTSI